MRIERIELATADDRAELRLHPNLSLVTGLGRLEREALTNEVLGAIGRGRAGLSVDVVADDGRCLEVHRPLTGPATVRDAVTCEDLTDHFLAGESVDILGVLGLPRAKARSLLHFSQRNLNLVGDVDTTIARLAGVDQDLLWSTAIRLAEVEVEMASMLDGEIDDPLAEYAAEIEQAHADSDLAADRNDRARSQGGFGAVALIFVSIAVGLITRPLLAIPFLLAAAVMGGWTWFTARTYETAADAEQEVLTRAGVSSYLNFQMKKVDELTSDKEVRSRSVGLAEQHRLARENWETVVGKGVGLEWAASHRPEISEQAVRFASGEAPGFPPGHGAECLAQAFVEARGAVGETVPLLLDEAFATLDDLELLEVQNALTTYSPHMQFLIMSNDPRMVQWVAKKAENQEASIVHLGRGANTLPASTEPTTNRIVQPLESLRPGLGATAPAQSHQLN